MAEAEDRDDLAGNPQEDIFQDTNALAVLYSLDEDPERKEFLDELFEFMVKNGTPIMRVPVMSKQPLDLFRLFRHVVKRGGVLSVINNKQWREIRDCLGLPSSITSAAYTLRSQYIRYLYPFECHKYGLSQPREVDDVIERNQRESRPLNSFFDQAPNAGPSYDLHSAFSLRSSYLGYYNPLNTQRFEPLLYGRPWPFSSLPINGGNGDSLQTARPNVPVVPAENLTVAAAAATVAAPAAATTVGSHDDQVTSKRQKTKKETEQKPSKPTTEPKMVSVSVRAQEPEEEDGSMIFYIEWNGTHYKAIGRPVDNHDEMQT